jgi:hypothetical protein
MVARCRTIKGKMTMAPRRMIATEDDRDGLNGRGEDTAEKVAPDAASESSVGRNARIVILSVLTVVGCLDATSLGIMRVTFLLL